MKMCKVVSIYTRMNKDNTSWIQYKHYTISYFSASVLKSGSSQGSNLSQ